jgi:hypothetical protein
MKNVMRLLALLLLFALVLTALVACKPRGEFVGPLGDSYRFSGNKYRHCDSMGNVSKGTYRVEDDFITFTPKGSDASFSLPYKKNSSKSLTIGEVTYKK